MNANTVVSEPQNLKRQPQIVSQKEWLAARLRLLTEEKELTRRSDELARRRQELPWVRVDQAYHSTRRKAAPRWQTSSVGARNFSSTTSCSGPTTRPDA